MQAHFSALSSPQHGSDDARNLGHPAHQLFPAACNGVSCEEILAAIKTTEDVRQFWRGYRAVGAVCAFLLLVELIFVAAICGGAG